MIVGCIGVLTDTPESPAPSPILQLVVLLADSLFLTQISHWKEAAPLFIYELDWCMFDWANIRHVMKFWWLEKSLKILAKNKDNIASVEPFHDFNKGCYGEA